MEKSEPRIIEGVTFDERRAAHIATGVDSIDWREVAKSAEEKRRIAELKDTLVYALRENSRRNEDGSYRKVVDVEVKRIASMGPKQALLEDQHYSTGSHHWPTKRILASIDAGGIGAWHTSEESLLAAVAEHVGSTAGGEVVEERRPRESHRHEFTATADLHCTRVDANGGRTCIARKAQANGRDPFESCDDCLERASRKWDGYEPAMRASVAGEDGIRRERVIVTERNHALQVVREVEVERIIESGRERQTTVRAAGYDTVTSEAHELRALPTDEARGYIADCEAKGLLSRVVPCNQRNEGSGRGLYRDSATSAGRA